MHWSTLKGLTLPTLAALISPRLLLVVITVVSAIILYKLPVPRVFSALSIKSMASVSGSNSSLPKAQAEWRKALEELPSTPDNIPAFFFAHGSPMLAFPEADVQKGPVMQHMGPKGPLAMFLKDFGPVLLRKYKPRGIVVFSAHWETAPERVGALVTHVSDSCSDSLSVTDYGDKNPLLMDYYGFQPALYQLKFDSRGDSSLAQRVVQLYKEVRQ